MTSFNLFLSNFHFVRPYWLLAIFALLFVLWLLKKHRFYQSPWQQFLPSHLSQVLLEGSSSANISKKSVTRQFFLIKPFMIGLLSIIALAGPVWQKLPQPVYQTERGSVLIMDMSYSMYSTDVKPNRLTRARFKAVDLLAKINEGDTGLIAYAGDAFVISPLTQDIKNIELLLPSLTPEIMPELGSNPIAALTLAHEMLLNAGHLNGDIYWFTDDIDNEEVADVYDWSSKYGHQLNILGIGSESGAPITLPSGELLKDNKGAIVVPRLPTQKLKSLASRGHGSYQTISNDDSDIESLILKDKIHERNKNKKQQNQQSGDQWQEQGAWLLVLVLPLMLSYFRRGSTLLMLPLSCLPLLFLLSFPFVSSTSFAAENEEQKIKQPNSPQTSTLTNTSKQVWQNLWQTSDQQAQKQYNKENYQDAAQQFKNSQWQGSAHYKAGNYQEALDAFKKGELGNSATSLYNQGNALAQMQQYKKAIESYEQALKKKPDLQDAKDNIEKIKQLQKQQEQQKSDKSDKEQSQDKDNKEKDQQQDSQSQDEQSQDQQNKQNQDQSEDSQQQDSESESQKDNKEQESKPKGSSEEQKSKEAEQKQQEQKNAEQVEKQDEQNEEKTAAQIAAEQQAKETEQKHQQILNKVTDDPYLLLRNKMQLEYQKRKQDGASRGVKKKW
jgi:Ca-activated chloride channel family protein